MRLILVIITGLWAGCALAQGAEVLRPDLVRDMARQPHLGAADFARALAEGVPGYRPADPPRLDRAAEADPFLWVVQGAFGAPGAGVPAGLIHCARYGLATRDRMAGGASSDPDIFPLFTATRAEGDDAALWPDAAVALLRCSFAWDDARRLRPWIEAEAQALLGEGFAQVIRADDATIRARTGAHIRAQYGPGGFRLDGTDGTRSSFYWVERMQVIRQLSHQRVGFRVFLLSGGV